MISTSSNKIDEIVVPDEIETYVSMPSCLLQGCSNDLIIFRADGGNHFTHYGKSRVDGYDDFIFVNRYGDVQNQGNLNKALRRMMRDCNDEILEKYGADSDPVLLPQFSCHILRHTFATRLCESGANLKFIQSILGHADVSTTMNIYVDVTDALKKKEITAFDDYMTTKLET